MYLYVALVGDRMLDLCKLLSAAGATGLWLRRWRRFISLFISGPQASQWSLHQSVRCKKAFVLLVEEYSSTGRTLLSENTNVVVSSCSDTAFTWPTPSPSLQVQLG